MRESANGQLMELIVNAHRRIRILEILDDFNDDKQRSLRVNGRRSSVHQRRSVLNEQRKKATTLINPLQKLAEQSADGGSNPNQNSETAEEETRLIYARTENFIADAMEKTVEIKVSKISSIKIP